MNGVKEKIVLQYDNTVSFFTDAFARLRVHEGFRRYFKNTGWIFVGKIITMIVAFFVTAYLARYLGPSNYGILSYAISFSGLFSFIASLGIDNILFRELVAHPDEQRKYFGTALMLKFIGAFFAFLLVCVVSAVLNGISLTTIMIAIIAASFFFQPFSIISYYFQSKVISRNPTIMSIIVAVTLSVLKIIFVILGVNVFYFSFIFMSETILYAIGYVYLYHKEAHSVFHWYFNSSIAKRMLMDSWPIILAAAFTAIYSRIDQIIIGQLMNSAAVGLYDVAARLSEAWYFFPAAIVSSLFPAIINAKKVGEDFYAIRLKRLYSLLIWFSLGIIVPIFILSHVVVVFLYGSAYGEAVPVLQIYVWAGVAVSLGVAVNQYLIAENYTKIIFISSMVGMVTNVLLNILFIPRYGIIGGAIATLISYSLVPLSMAFFKKTRKQLKFILQGFVFNFK